LRDVTIVSGAVFCGLILLCVGGTSRGAESASHPDSADEYLARAADCVACHSIPGGKAFAGGLKMGTPLGAIYSTNITPDPETGIGKRSGHHPENALATTSGSRFV
jgi:alcohol dehydrogenase (quinone), cytochrome c subunit